MALDDILDRKMDLTILDLIVDLSCEIVEHAEEIDDSAIRKQAVRSAKHALARHQALAHRWRKIIE
jgi:hypothetical protein